VLQRRLIATEDQLIARATELGGEMSAHYAGVGPPLLVCVLKGSAIFLADLMRAMSIECEVDFMAISSYVSSGGAPGVVRIVKDLERDVRGRHVVIVEDIVDTGLTLHYLRRALGAREPASLRTVTLLDKAARRIVPVPLEWVGFEIPDVFVVGYGLDFHGIYRNVRDLGGIDDVSALAAAPQALVPALFPGAG